MDYNNKQAREVLDSYTHKDPPREWMGGPFILNGYSVATDGFSLLYFYSEFGGAALPDSVAPDDHERMILQMIHHRYKTKFKFNSAEFMAQTPPVLIDEILNPECPECNGVGWIFGKNSPMDKDATACEKCESTGELEIETGNRIHDPMQAYKIAGRQFTWITIKRIHFLIQKLGLKEFTFFDVVTLPDLHHSLLTFPGGGLILMPFIGECPTIKETTLKNLND